MVVPHLASPVLRRLLEAAGYRIEDRPGVLCASRALDRRALVIVDAPRSPVELESAFPSDAVHRILVYPLDPGDVARGLASERGMEVLDATTLGPALGEILLPGPDAPGIDRGEVDTGEMFAPTTVFPGGERTVHPRLTRADAEAMAGVERSRVTLRLIPFFLAPYRVRPVSAHGGPGASSDHLVAVNALSGRVEVWEPGERDLTDHIDEPHQKLEPQKSAAECRALAEESLRKRHTVSVDHTEQHGGALVIERRKVPPSSGDLKVGPSVLVHVPYWYVESAGGRIVLDAVSGSRALWEEKEDAPLR
ncbi:MAG: hypothetical protein L3J96_03880 [Thermoplasmata archaeon]|nr:hypothetical protein [Thermoplasmata archaeon]